MDKRVLNISNYRQADAVVVAAAADAAAGQLLADDADRLPHQAVNWHVPVRRPRWSRPRIWPRTRPVLRNLSKP